MSTILNPFSIDGCLNVPDILCAAGDVRKLSSSAVLVLFEFSLLSSDTKSKLFLTYCMDLYGSQLWNYGYGGIIYTRDIPLNEIIALRLLSRSVLCCVEKSNTFNMKITILYTL